MSNPFVHRGFADIHRSGSVGNGVVLIDYKLGSFEAKLGANIASKRLEEGQFIWPAVRDGKISITRSQLAMLLYAIEEAIRGLPATERLAARQSQSKPLLVSLHEWLVEKSATLSKKSRLGEAFAYALNQWDALCYYCDDGLTMQRSGPYGRYVLVRKITSSSAATTVASVEPCCMD